MRALTVAEFAAQREAIARTFGTVQDIPIPQSLPDDTVRKAIHQYLAQNLAVAIQRSSIPASTPASAPSVMINNSGTNGCGWMRMGAHAYIGSQGTQQANTKMRQMGGIHGPIAHDLGAMVGEISPDMMFNVFCRK